MTIPRTIPPPPNPTTVCKGGLPRIPVGVFIAASFCAGLIFCAAITLGAR